MLFIGADNRLWCAESDGTRLTLAYLENYSKTWSTRQTIATGDFTQPSAVDRGDGEIVIRAVNNSDGLSYQFRTRDGGAHVTPDGVIS